MTRKCCVSACTKDAKHLFKLPEILTTSWLKVINRPGWTPSRNSRICSQHFSPNNIVNYRFLRRGAEPLLHKHIFKERNIMNRMCSSVLLSLNATQPEIFSNLDEHVDSNLASHKVAMVKKIVTIYVSLRLKHFCREKNNNVSNKMIRTKLTKSILFQGQ